MTYGNTHSIKGSWKVWVRPIIKPLKDVCRILEPYRKPKPRKDRQALNWL